MSAGRFELTLPSRIVFARGAVAQSGELLAALGRTPLLVSGVPPSVHENVLGVLRAVFPEICEIEVRGEPTLSSVLKVAELVRTDHADFVIGLGGGSAIDTAKAAAALAVNPGDPLDFLEVVGRGQPLQHAPLPCAAIPTTAGTGSEATKNAVIRIPEAGAKVSLRHSGMMPQLALLDPDLTLDLPADVTAATGMDALTQVLEPFVCTRANPFTDALCGEALARVGTALPAAFRNGQDAAARADMMLVSLYGGLALANAGLGAAHGFAAPLGGMLAAPHGAICARLLPGVASANIRALRRRPDGESALERYRRAAVWLTGRPLAGPEDGAEWLAGLSNILGIPRLSTLGLTREAFDSVVDGAQKASSMKANPVLLDREELIRILEDAL